jgi:excisionase family DNA binding protein
MEQLLIQISDHFRPIIQQEVRNALNEYKTRIEAPKDEKLYSRKETATKLNISLVTLTKHVNDGKITAHKVGVRVLFRAEDIEKCLSKIQTKGGVYKK